MTIIQIILAIVLIQLFIRWITKMCLRGLNSDEYLLQKAKDEGSFKFIMFFYLTSYYSLFVTIPLLTITYFLT